MRVPAPRGERVRRHFLADGRKPQSVEMGKDIIAGLAGMEVDKRRDRGTQGLDRTREARG